MDASEGPLFHADPDAPETVLWRGQPGQLYPLIISPVLLIFVTIVGFFVLVALQAIIIHPLWFALLPVLPVLYVVSMRRSTRNIRAKRSSMVYVLTSQRVVRYSGADQRIVHSTRLEELMDVTLTVRKDGTGTIMCRSSGYGAWPTRNPKGRRRALFRQISDVEMVYRLLQDALASVTPDELNPFDRQRIWLGRREDGTSTRRWRAHPPDERWQRTPGSHLFDEPSRSKGSSVKG
ncbi:MAG TPA: hypothetical protein VEW66_01950 [Thermomicrobiales bacterium]|nr:hypothetical protein [Thermomicrobiales bacterium]